MENRLIAVKIRYEDQSYSNQIPIGVLAENVEYDKQHNLIDILGNVDLTKTDNIQNQITQNKIDLAKINTATPSDIDKVLKVKTVSNGKVTQWNFGEATSSAISSYFDLENKPSIEGIILEGDKTFEELNLQGITNSELENILRLN